MTLKRIIRGTVFVREITVWDILLRLGIAMLAGVLVGGERARTYHPAGLRTHMLVAIGACSVMITGDMLSLDMFISHGAMPDPARLGAQVVSGIGFLGAGTIIKEGMSIRGLTTAASLWAVACISLAAGAGYPQIALLGMAAIYITLTGFSVIQRALQRHTGAELSIRLECEQMADVLLEIDQQAQQNSAMVMDLNFGRTTHNTYAIAFRIAFRSKEWQEAQSRFSRTLAGLPGILTMENDRL